MEISSAQHQLMASHTLDQILTCPTPQLNHHHHHHLPENHQLRQPENKPHPPEKHPHQPENQQLQQTQPAPQEQARKPRPNPDQALKCPRCDSTNTKFCYYNNYSLSQPRYFCKGCRRYWTQGGSLRNVPVGGGCRKNKRSTSSSSPCSPSLSSNSKKLQEINPSPMLANNTNPTPALLSSLLPPPPPSATAAAAALSYDPSDLTLAFACSLNKPSVIARQQGLGFLDEHDHGFLTSATTNPNLPSANGFLDFLRGTAGFMENNNSNSNNNNSSSNNNNHNNNNNNNNNNNENADTSGGFQGFYYGYNCNNNGTGGVGLMGGTGGEDMVMPQPPFEGSVMTESETTGGTVAASNTTAGIGIGMGMGMGIGNSFILESGRDYWNSVGSANSWHGLINSSLM